MYQNHYLHPAPKKATKPSQAKGKANVADAEAARPPPGIVRLSAQRPKYQITDISGKLQIMKKCVVFGLTFIRS